MRVLILDDSFLEGEKIKADVLGVLGASTVVDVASDVTRARLLISRHAYELGIFDVRLEGSVSGIDFLKSLRRSGGAPEKVLLVSSFADEEVFHVTSDKNMYKNMDKNTAENISLLPKDYHERSGELRTPLKHVLKSLMDSARAVFQKVFPGRSLYAQETRELLYYAKSHPEHPTLLSGPGGSGKTTLAVSLISALYPELNKAFIETWDCKTHTDQMLAELERQLVKIQAYKNPHCIIENIHLLPEAQLPNLLKLLERFSKTLKIVLTQESTYGWAAKSNFRSLFHAPIAIKQISERTQDLQDIVQAFLSEISVDVIKKLTPQSWDILTQNMPGTYHELKHLLVQACINSGTDFYITPEHLFGKLDPTLVSDLDLSEEQFEKLNSFCRFIKQLKDAGLDQVDIYKHVTKLREPLLRSDYEKQYGLSTLPPRSTLNRILDHIKNAQGYTDIKNKTIEDIPIHEIVSLRK